LHKGTLKTLAALIFVTAAFPVSAQEYTSTYTKLDFDKHCTIFEKYRTGLSAKCTGYKDYPVYFSEGDLRAMVRFGHTTPKTERWESFGQFNTAGNTIEWRLSAGIPKATILRWYIDTENAQTGDREEGQVLVISTVAGFDNPDNACVAGYVDARANSNANILARNVADTIAPHFKCGVNSPEFHGERGPYSGNP